MTALERIVVVLAGFLLAIAIIAVLSGGLLAGRDSPGVSGHTGAIGAVFADLGHQHLRPGEPAPPYDSQPPTSGAHVPRAITRDGQDISDDQLLQALETGDVVFMYGTRRPPAGLEAAARSVAPPFSAALAAAGQAVILARRAGTDGILGLAWTRLVRVSRAADPLLTAFARDTLGQGAPGG